MGGPNNISPIDPVEGQAQQMPNPSDQMVAQGMGGPPVDPMKEMLAQSFPTAQAGQPDPNAQPLSQSDPGDDQLLAALLKRGKKKRTSIVLDDDVLTPLIERVTRDFYDAAGAMRERYLNQVELVKNWEGIVDPKTFPYEDAANIRVPFSSSQTQQWSARIVKALLGGEQVTQFEALDESIDAEGLAEANQWFQWELDEIVELAEAVEKIVQACLIGGNCFPIPVWKKERRSLQDYREFDFDQSKPIGGQLQAAIEMIYENKDVEIKKVRGAGIFDLAVRDPNESEPDEAKVIFSIRNNRLCAQSECTETIFEGVRITVPNEEDLVLINTNPDLEKLPFNGLRLWEDIASYRNGIKNGKWLDLGQTDNNRILATATVKTEEVVPMDYTNLQDEEEGTDSRDVQGTDYERRFIEIYRWEGWIHPKLDENDDAQDVALSDAVQVAMWIVPRARLCIKIERLEALNKDGKRSMIKWGFIPRPNRLFDIGLVEWLRHVQAELDGIHNLRLDSSTLNVMPFGFYKPLAGMQKDIYNIKPGTMMPTADPSSVNFPKTNSSPQWSFQDEQTVEKYGYVQSGLNDAATGSFISKRQSASEYLGTANAVDLRTEAIVVGFLRSLRKLLYRVFGLYQQFAPATRIFQAGGAEGVKLVKQFEMDRLQGKILLRLTGNLDQINPQLQRDVAVNMMQLLMNQILIQLGIVKPDTIYQAITHVAKTMNYKGVILHKPDLPAQSPSPNVENKMMAMGQQVEPHLDENFDEHLRSHMGALTDPRAKQMFNTKAIQLMMMHIQQTQKMQQIAAYLRQQESLMATTMGKNMQSMGIRPGLAGGQQTGDGAGAGSEGEGVEGAQSAAA